ncbi:MAG: radical SAM protein, partial [Rhodothermales bacterium]
IEVWRRLLRVRLLNESTWLKEDNCRRLRKNGFKAILPGIESWYDIGGKSKMRSAKGMEKVRRVAEHVNMILQYIPYVQANLILGLDVDEGDEPFELTRHFVDLAPGAFPFFSLLMAYGRNAPDNLRYQREDRVLNIPFHFLNQLHSMNVRPKHYTWPAFFDHVCEVYAYAFSRRALFRRFKATRDPVTRFDQLFRGWASERNHKLVRNHMKMRDRLRTDQALLRYLDGETTTLPGIYVEPIQRDLKWLWEWLPEGAMYHDPNAYLKSLETDVQEAPRARAGMTMT